LEIAARGAKNRRTYTSPCSAFYHIADRVFEFQPAPADQMDDRCYFTD
jgi:hypothetical protein